MNATPTGGTAEPSRDGTAHQESDHPDTDPSLPAPRPGDHPLPRRVRPESTSAPSDREPARNPDGRAFDPVDDSMLSRLLSGLRDI